MMMPEVLFTRPKEHRPNSRTKELRVTQEKQNEREPGEDGGNTTHT